MRRALLLILALGTVAVIGLSGCEQAGEQVGAAQEMDCSATCAVAGSEPVCQTLCEGAPEATHKEVICSGSSADQKPAVCDGCPGSEVVAACSHSDGGSTCVESCKEEDCSGDCPIHGHECDQVACAHLEHGTDDKPATSAPACPGMAQTAGSAAGCPSAAKGVCPRSAAALPADAESSSR